jgi:hypothetical protein
MLRLLLTPAIFVGAFVASADAQPVTINPNKPGVPAPATAAAEPVRITVGVSTFIPTPGGEGDAALKAQEEGRRLIYDIAGHECAMMLQAFASDCHIESINVNVQRVPNNQFFNGQKGEGFNVNGNFSYRVVPK